MRPGWSAAQMAAVVGADLWDGAYVNLGVGLPTRVMEFLPGDREVLIHSENGILGAGPPPPAAQVDWDLIDAGKRPITLAPGGCYFSHADSFIMIRGGHLDLAVLGAFEVSSKGDLANWHPGVGVPAVGGAMDLAVGARDVWVMMWHADGQGHSKLVDECRLPVTGFGVVSRVYTNLGVFEPAGSGLICRRLADDVGAEQVADSTSVPVEFDLTVSPPQQGQGR